MHTTLSAEEFFDKCNDGTLDESGFDFVKPHKSEKSVKGSVREKITVLPDMERTAQHMDDNQTIAVSLKRETEIFTNL